MIRSSGPVVFALARAATPRHTVDVSRLSQDVLPALRRGRGCRRDGHMDHSQGPGVPYNTGSCLGRALAPTGLPPRGTFPVVLPPMKNMPEHEACGTRGGVPAPWRPAPRSMARPWLFFPHPASQEGRCTAPPLRARCSPARCGCRFMPTGCPPCCWPALHHLYAAHCNWSGQHGKRPRPDRVRHAPLAALRSFRGVKQRTCTSVVVRAGEEPRRVCGLHKGPPGGRRPHTTSRGAGHLNIFLDSGDGAA
jgi:hypothetical protein